MFGHGFGWGALNVIGTLVDGLFTFFVLLVAAGLIFLLVRFLLVATIAAKIYVARNAPPKPDPAPTSAPEVATPPEPDAEPTKPTSTPRAKPASTPRARKKPPPPPAL